VQFSALMEMVQGQGDRDLRHSPSPSARRRTALIVDECAAIHTAIREALAPEFDCEAVLSVEQALAAASSHLPQVIISDVAIGGADGYELCRQVRADRRLHEVPVILLTANPDPEGRATGLEVGADDYLSKPFRPRELLARVRSLVRLRDARQDVLRQNRELERAHDELLQSQRQLLEAERLATAGTIATGLAHAINNPLSVVWAGFEEMSDCIRRLASPPGEAGAIDSGDIEVVRAEVRSSLERIRGIVQQLAVLGGPEDHRRATIDVHAEINRAVAIAHARLGRVELKRRCEGPPTIQAPPGYLTLILTPVLINAAEAVASVPRPRVEIRTRRVEQGLEIVVEDNGVGICGEVVPQVFDPFFTTKPAGEGSGLGLAVCQRLIGRLGGSAQLVSQAGRGTQFRISLPLEPPAIDSSLRPRRPDAAAKLTPR
jgi:signal transduction histidine kinase